MWLLRQRMWQSGHLFAFCSLLLAAGFLLQLKALYLNHMRNQRMQEYTRMVKELSAQMDRVGRVANTTNYLLGGLQAKVRREARNRVAFKIS